MLGARDAVGINHERAFLAFADVRVEFQGLAESHPDRRCEILDRCGHPERENVDSAIGLAVMAQRAGDPAGGVFGVPWFDPRAHAFFKVGHDLGGDAGVNVLTFCYSLFSALSFPPLKLFSFRPSEWRPAFRADGPSQGGAQPEFIARPLTGSTALVKGQKKSEG